MCGAGTALILRGNGVAVIVVVLAMHIAQAAILLVDTHATGGIALSTMLDTARWLRLGGAHSLGILMLGFAGCTVLALTVRLGHPLIALTLMLPQQALLTIAATGAVGAIIDSSYADGVLRSRGFILADQLPLFVILATHTVAAISLSRRRCS